MSITLMSRCWNLPATVPSGARLVLLAMADHASDDGVCWPGVAGIANKTGLTERTVQYHLTAMKEAGYLRSTPRAGRTNLYTLTLPAQSIAPLGCNPLHHGGEVDCTPGVKPIAPEPSVESSVEPSVQQKPSAALPPDFVAFWKEYPKKVGRKAALKEWLKAKDKPDIATILAAIAAQKKGSKWRDGYVLDPERWLKRGCWDDEVITTRPQADDDPMAGMTPHHAGDPA